MLINTGRMLAIPLPGPRAFELFTLMFGSTRRLLYDTHRYLSESEPLLSYFKYGIFLCLAITSSVYIAADIAAAKQMLNGTSDFMDTLSAYAISIDVVGWFILLVIFELETSSLDDELLNRGWKWLLYAISALCYIAISYAFAGYLGKLVMITNFVPALMTDLCILNEPALTLMEALDSFVPVTEQNCSALNVALENGQIFKLDNQSIIFEIGTYYGIGGSWSIAWSDFIEAILWILVMGLIQLEIVLQLRGGLSPWILNSCVKIKVVSYFLIVVVTTYYSLFGRSVDLWDSILWLLAFLFIELNISNWNEEVAEKSADHSPRINSPG